MITRKFAAGKLLWYAKKVQAKVQRLSDRAMHKTAIAIINTAKESMKEPKHGNPPRSRAQKTTASAPGEAPAVQTGKLRSSLAVEKVKEKHYRAGTNLPYGRYLELGIGMDKRPYLRPALDKNRDTFDRFLKGGPKL